MKIYDPTGNDEAGDFRFPSPDEIGPLHRMTCVNHPEGRWLTKHPAMRNIHWVGWYDDNGEEYRHHDYGIWECPCPFRDLRADLRDEAKS